MNRVKEVNVFGVGRVSRRAVAEAARRHPDVGFRFFSRNPRRYPPSPLANVCLFSPAQLNNDGTPLVLCMASDEGRIVRELQRRGTGVVPRSAVAAANLRLAHRPSILQDLEAGRPMEIDALYTVPQEMARARGVATPTLDLLASLIRVKARARALYSG